MYLQRRCASGGQEQGTGRAPYMKQSVVALGAWFCGWGWGTCLSHHSFVWSHILKWLPGCWAQLTFSPDNINYLVPLRGGAERGEAADAFQVRASGDKVQTIRPCAASWPGRADAEEGVGQLAGKRKLSSYSLHPLPSPPPAPKARRAGLYWLSICYMLPAAPPWLASVSPLSQLSGEVGSPWAAWKKAFTL